MSTPSVPFQRPPFAREIGAFPLFRQETDHTCGPAAVRMVLSYYSLDVSEAEVAERCLTLPTGTLHWGIDAALDEYLAPLRLESELSGMVSERRVIRSLAKDRPVVVLFATSNELSEGEPCLHYGVLIGLDEMRGVVTIANPFGRREELALAPWWERFSLEDRFLPDYGSIAVDLDLLQPRTCFLIHRRTTLSRIMRSIGRWWLRLFGPLRNDCSLGARRRAQFRAPASRS
ncbi:MAG: C39 family peptidase [Hyphomicrobiales bacterium]|nr:C39 family peptidase [Hyphomicrobiales bacterium]